MCQNTKEQILTNFCFCLYYFCAFQYFPSIFVGKQSKTPLIHICLFCLLPFHFNPFPILPIPQKMAQNMFPSSQKVPPSPSQSKLSKCRWLLLLLCFQLYFAISHFGHNVPLLVLTAEHKYSESKMAIQLNLALTICWIFSLALAIVGEHRKWAAAPILLPHFCLTFLLIPYHFLIFVALITSRTAKFLPILNSLLCLAVLLATIPFGWSQIREGQQNGGKDLI